MIQTYLPHDSLVHRLNNASHLLEWAVHNSQLAHGDSLQRMDLSKLTKQARRWGRQLA